MATKKDLKLGKSLQRLRKKADLKQEQLAGKAGLSSKYIQFLERGVRQPSLKALYKIARALGIKVKDIFPF